MCFHPGLPRYMAGDWYDPSIVVLQYVVVFGNHGAHFTVSLPSEDVTHCCVICFIGQAAHWCDSTKLKSEKTDKADRGLSPGA